MKEVTCGLIVTNSEKFLICHSTGNELWDLPKGKRNEKESHLNACVREVEEETGLKMERHKNKFIDLGIYPYLKTKDIHLYIHFVKNLPPIEQMICTSYFKNRVGMQLPEIDSFKYIQWEQTELLFGINMRRVLTDIRQRGYFF